MYAKYDNMFHIYFDIIKMAMFVCNTNVACYKIASNPLRGRVLNKDIWVDDWYLLLIILMGFL